MQALRLNEVLSRVVAWHNRHPLARRITANQVHSIGEVVLPFASALAAAAPPAQSALPRLQDLAVPVATGLSDPQAGADDKAQLAQADPPEPTEATEDAAAEPAMAMAMAMAKVMADPATGLLDNDPPVAVEPQASPDDGPEMLVDLSPEPDEGPLATPAEGPLADADEPAPELSTADADNAELAAAFAGASDLEAAPLAAAAAIAAAPELDRPAGLLALSLVRSLALSLARLLAHPLAGLKGWRRGGAAGLPKLQATFSRDFIWPLRPGQVARWARRHGSVVALAPADWPQRQIDTDAALLAQAWRRGLPHAMPLHLLTAAIGVGDRRIRVLVAAKGHILGPRSYSPPRLATLASGVALGLLGAGWGWLPNADSRIAKEASAAVAAVAAASAAAQAASSAELAAAASAASAADRVLPAQQAASMAAAPAASDAQPAEPQPAELKSADAEPPDTPAAEAPQTDTHQAAAPAAEPAVAPASRQLGLPLGSVLPPLSAAEKLVARQQVEAARTGRAAAIARQAAQPPQPVAPVFAVVTRPTREKDSAARGLALIRASGQRLAGEQPEHGELMLHHGEWRAAWWPFESLADAERARVMLAARGLKVEVVEF